MTFDFSAILSGDNGIEMLSGAETTLALFISAWTIALVLALFLLAVRASRVKACEYAVMVYVEYHRNVPGLVQLLIWYFGVPQLLPRGVQFWINQHNGEFIYALIGLSLNAAAYMSEDLRSGMRAIPAQQQEAARALGLNYVQAMKDVIIPQALRHACPSLVNQALGLFKSTSLAMAIGVTELTYVTRQIESVTYQTFKVFAVATLFYLLVSSGITAIGSYLNKAGRIRR